jgi:hypothetical protein
MLDMWTYSNFQRYAKHADNLFFNSKNMVKAIGFNATCNSWTKTSHAFAGCASLIYTDFVLPRTMNGDGPAMFCNGCVSLKKDITEFFPDGFVLSRTGRALLMFMSCKNLYGDVSKIAKYLWDSEYPWILPTNLTQLPFLGCSAEIRAQVPVSWGGTAPDTIIAPAVSTEIADVKSTVAELDNKMLSIEQQLAGLETALEEI